jgi:hypothetical protein
VNSNCGLLIVRNVVVGDDKYLNAHCDLLCDVVTARRPKCCTVNKGAVLLRLPSLPRDSPLVCRWRKAYSVAPEKFRWLIGPTTILGDHDWGRPRVKEILSICLPPAQRRGNFYCASMLPADSRHCSRRLEMTALQGGWRTRSAARSDLATPRCRSRGSVPMRLGKGMAAPSGGQAIFGGSSSEH